MSLTPSLAAEATLRSLLQRVRLGEGGLIGMATWVAAWRTHDPFVAAYVFGLTTALLTALYLFNDVSDRVIDAHNPKKIAVHRQVLLQHPRLFLAVSLGLHVVVCTLAWYLLGSTAAVAAASLLVLNPLYSGLLKRVPGLDVLVVGAMGGAVVAVATSETNLILMAAAMTGISHAFQTRVDAKADRAAGVHSSGATAASLRWLIWVGLALWYGLTAYALLGPWAALSALIPFALLSFMPEANHAWAWARLYFAALWVLAAT